MSTIQEAWIRQVVAEVVQRLQAAGEPAVAAAPARGPSPTARVSSGRHGVFDDVPAAVAAAAACQCELVSRTLEQRGRILGEIRRICVEQAEELGRMEFEETRIGRLEHKFEKLRLVGDKIPGLEALRTDAQSGDHGLVVTEYTPWGVIGAVTPVTHSVPTLASNAISFIAAGNAAVFNPHPGAWRVAIEAVRRFNQAIERVSGMGDLICAIQNPTLETSRQIFEHPDVPLLVVTGGGGVVKAAMQTPKRAICAGPGNPPVVVDETANIERAARDIVKGASYDNNILCIGEKEVFVVEKVADALIAALKRHHAHQLDAAQIAALTAKAFKFGGGGSGGCNEPVLNKAYVGKDATFLAAEIGVAVPPSTLLLFGETPHEHPFVQEEQMMPFLPVVRARDVDHAIALAKEAERGYKHTAIIHSTNVEHMTRMARALQVTLFVKNGPCMAGLGVGGEGAASFSIATPTGEGITTSLTFTRVRRCVMVDNLRIF